MPAASEHSPERTQPATRAMHGHTPQHITAAVGVRAVLPTWAPGLAPRLVNGPPRKGSVGNPVGQLEWPSSVSPRRRRRRSPTLAGRGLFTEAVGRHARKPRQGSALHRLGTWRRCFSAQSQGQQSQAHGPLAKSRVAGLALPGPGLAGPRLGRDGEVVAIVEFRSERQAGKRKPGKTISLEFRFTASR